MIEGGMGAGIIVGLDRGVGLGVVLKMEGETRLESATFQLTPTRTRCELVISGGGVSEKVASGLVRPFVSHLRVAEEQIARGGYSIKLDPPAGSQPWFTKATMERFVRFVSTPEVLERSNTIETEIAQIEKCISVQCSQETLLSDEKATALGLIEANKMIVDANGERAIVPFMSRRDTVDGIQPAQGENSKVRLLRVLETRKMALQKEQGMAYARAIAAGFDIKHMADLVSFAECFGAVRLRKACLNFMDLCKRKHESGLWLDEMELATTEASLVQSDMSSMGASGIILAGDSVLCQVVGPKIPTTCDDPSNQSELNRTGAVPDANGAYAISNHDTDNRSSLKHQAPPEMSGSHQDNIQLPTMPGWSGQPPQCMQNFQSFIAGPGPGPPMQGFHGFPIQGMQIGSHYYQSYPGNPHWPQFVENPMLGTVKMTELSGWSNISAGLKHHVMNEKETESPKSISSSEDHTDRDEYSDLEKESMLAHESNRQKRRAHTGRSSKKKPGMVVIRNINYITSKRHDEIDKDVVAKESGPERESNSGYGLKEEVEDVIGVSERMHKDIGSLPKQKGAHRHSVDGCTSWKKDGKHEMHDLNVEAGGREDDNQCWQVFQKHLLGDDKPSLNNLQNEKNGDIHVVEQANEQKSANGGGKIYNRDTIGLQHGEESNVCSPDAEMVFKGKNDMIGKASFVLSQQDGKHEDSSLQLTLKLEGTNCRPGLGIKEDMSNERLLLPRRDDSVSAEKVGYLGSQSFAELELSSMHKRPMTDDLFIISQQAGKMDLDWPNSQRIAADNVEHTTTLHDDPLRAGKSYGQSLVDDSFMLPTRSIGHEQGNIEWKTQINMDAELPSIEKAEHFSYNVTKKISETNTSCEPDDLFIMPERDFERDSRGLSWNPVLDDDIQVSAKVADKRHLDPDRHGYVDKIRSPSKKKSDANVRELQGTKKTGHEDKLKVMDQSQEKKKAGMAGGSGKSVKSNVLSNAQLHAEKLHSSKVGQQKSKKEKEEEERKRVEELLIERQKRIAGRTNSCVNKSTTTSCLSKQQLKLQKGRTSNNIGSVCSMSGPMTKTTTEAINKLTLHKSNLSNHSGHTLNKYPPSQSEQNNENGRLFRQSGSSQATKNESSVGRSSEHGIATKAKKSGNIKVNGASSVSTRTLSKESNGKPIGLTLHKRGISH